MYKKNNANHLASFIPYVLLSLAGFIVAIGMYSYLGTFSRYIADDYCEAVQFNGTTLIGGTIERYLGGDWRAASRYSNLFFVGFGEMLGDDNMQIVMAGMVLLWSGGLVWCFYEIKRIFGIRWHVLMDVYFGLMFAFFSLLLAPNLFQTIYWRSSMMTHFAPLVLGVFLLAFLVRQSRHVKSQFLPWVCTFVFFASFLFAGFSEPPATTALVILPLIVGMIWARSSPDVRIPQIILFASSFAGVLLGFLVMFFSPAVSTVLIEKNPDLGLVFLNSFSYAFLFMLNTVQSLILPLGLSFLLPFLLVWWWKQVDTSQVLKVGRQRWWLAVLIPLFVWLLVAAGFAPSAFGQGFPVERMRFLASSLMIVALMTGGIWLGLSVPEFKSHRNIGVWASLVIFTFISVAYPLRAAYNVLQTLVPEYHARAVQWDLRNEYILQKVDAGVTDLIVPGLSGFNGVKEVDDSPAHWINVCVAQFYGVNTIEAVSVEEEYFLEMLSE